MAEIKNSSVNDKPYMTQPRFPLKPTLLLIRQPDNCDVT